MVAEGIESSDQLAAVLALGCDAVQGYFYSQPVSAPEALKWLLTRQLNEQFAEPINLEVS
jgi:EAL domain-containing protein (putative c-di-GMP-specific phosphodiesterase class I)